MVGVGYQISRGFGKGVVSVILGRGGMIGWFEGVEVMVLWWVNLGGGGYGWVGLRGLEIIPLMVDLGRVWR